MDDRSEQPRDAPLPLWRVLLEELRHLRPDGAGLDRPDFDNPEKTNADCLAPLFEAVHSWSAPAGAADPAPVESPAPEMSSVETDGKEGGAGTGASVQGQKRETPPTDTPPLTALCFSGGGIRSATFNLGVIQGLAKLGLLGRFDYLSSVSGGGYISGWLARWIHAAGGGSHGLEAVEEALTRAPRDPKEPEARQVTYLRRFSNYLTPRLGALSADTWTLVAIAVRNILLNWLVLLPLLTAPLLLPLLAVSSWHPVPVTGWWWLLIGAFFLEAVGLFFVNRFRDAAKDSPAGSTSRPGEEKEPERHPYLRLGLLPRLAALPLLLQGIFLYLQHLSEQKPPIPSPTWGGLIFYCLLWSVALPLTALWASGRLLGRNVWWDNLSLLLAGAIEAAILAAVLASWVPRLIESRYPLYPILGPGLVLGPMLLGRTLFVALSSVAEHWQVQEPFGDADREWWARWSAWTLISAVVWILGSALVLFAPSLLDSAVGKVTAMVSAGGFGGLIALLGKSARTPAAADAKAAKGQNGSRLQSLLVGLAAPLFVVAVMLCISTGAQHLLAAIDSKKWPPPADRSAPEVKAAGSLHLEITRAGAAGPVQQGARRAARDAPDGPDCCPPGHAPPPPIRADLQIKDGASKPPIWRYVPPFSAGGPTELAAIAALLLLGFVAGYPVNINRFSMQAGYRNRLIRAYLGASNYPRSPNAFTGFDRNDNVSLSLLWRNRPFPVINMALNLVRGKNLAWQERKAESFTATPLHCGAYQLGYRRTDSYGGRDGLTLGTAVATSGAAANPNMGFNSSPVLSLIMTLFSVRLGAWLGNPAIGGRLAPYKRSGPRSSAKVLLAEAFGWTDDSHPYVSLSDGGHFEDLGLYEMVRRRCRVILACDAGADPNYGFEDLGNAIRKIRIDFGIPIVFKERVYILPKQAASGQAASEQARYCALADIQYGAVDKHGATGTLIYIKPSICEEPPPATPFDVATYARFSRDFPHETTLDQWFSETQFESYRALGEDAVTAMAAFLEAGPCSSLDELVRRVKDMYLDQGKERGDATEV